MYLQAVRIPGDKHLVENGEQETQIEEILVKISSSNRYDGTKCVPYHGTPDSKNRNGNVRQDFEMHIKRCTQIIHQPLKACDTQTIPNKQSSQNPRRATRDKHYGITHRKDNRRHGDINNDESGVSKAIVKSRKPFKNVTSTDKTQHIDHQNTTKALLTYAEQRISLVKNDRDLSGSMRSSTAGVLPGAKRDYAKATNFSSFTSYGNNKDTAAEELSSTVEERTKFDTQPEPQRISKLSRKLVYSNSSPVAVVVNRIIEYQHSSESDCNNSDAIVAPKISGRTTDAVINPSGCRKELRGYNSCRYGSNMSRNKERKEKSFGADATGKSSTKSAPSKSSNRRESSSPDEGIVQSVDEMEDNELVYQMGQLDVAKKDRTAITIEGGRIRELKLKRRSGKRERGNNKIKNNEANEQTSEVSHNEKEKASTSSSKATVMKVSKAEKAIARKVVRQALNDNSVARSYKPVWVKLPRHAASNPEQVKKKINLGSAKKSTVNELNGDKDHEAVRTTRSKPHRNGVVHSNSVKEVSRRMLTKKVNSNADHRGHDKSESRKGNITKSSTRRKDPVRTDMRNKTSALKVSKHQRHGDVTKDTQKTTLVAYSHSKRTVSADSSVRDLSYSSSSSASATSSSLSKSTSSSFGSKSISSSSNSSRSCYSNATSSNDEDTHPDEVAETRRQTRYKSSPGQSSNSRTSRPRLKLHEYWRKNVRSKIQELEARSEAVDLNSKGQAARDIEKTFAQDEEEEFEVNLGKKRDRHRKQQVDSNDIAGEDVQKSLWQHHRLVMTSKQNVPSSSNRRTTEKLKPVAESTSATKPQAVENGGKDGVCASSQLTIRDIYSLHNVLSDTQNGTVIAGHRRTDGMRVAIKRISKSGTTRWGWMNGKVVPLELALLCQVNEIRHPGVVEIIEWHETAEAFLLVMARPNPSVDLYDHVTKQKRLDEAVARRITRQLLTALLHCQKMGVLHRDVKLENILFNPLTKEAILIDFGCGDYSRSGSYKEFAGTPEYYPPEWFIHKIYNGDSATVWSIGVLVYSLLCGTLPFRSSNDIINKEPTKFPAHISHRARNFICEALKKKCSERITITDIINHPWLKFSKDHSETRKTSV